MRRRRFIAGLALALGPGVSTHARAHTPYAQWTVYRRKHLLIGCRKDVDGTYSLARDIVRMLEAELPAASARVARAPNARRIASLMATGQMEVAVLDPDAAIAMAAGEGRFEPYGPVALRTLLRFPRYRLLARAGMPDRHAWLVTDALLDLAHATQVPDEALPWHPGAARRHRDEPAPG